MHKAKNKNNNDNSIEANNAILALRMLQTLFLVSFNSNRYSNKKKELHKVGKKLLTLMKIFQIAILKLNQNVLCSDKKSFFYCLKSVIEIAYLQKLINGFSNDELKLNIEAKLEFSVMYMFKTILLLFPFM